MKALECGECRACCQGPDRELILGHVDQMLCKHIGLAFDVDWRGTARLAQHLNGDCLYLGAKGCEVYADRPKACRAFDCRRVMDHPLCPERVREAALERI